MPKLKSSKLNRSALNKKSVSARWDTHKQLGKQTTGQILCENQNSTNPSQIDYDNPRPGSSNAVGLPCPIISFDSSIFFSFRL